MIEGWQLCWFLGVCTEADLWVLSAKCKKLKKNNLFVIVERSVGNAQCR